MIRSRLSALLFLQTARWPLLYRQRHFLQSWPACSLMILVKPVKLVKTVKPQHPRQSSSSKARLAAAAATGLVLCLM
jgi:hypothetical protein